MLKVINLYANNEGGVYGDIYTTITDLRKDHPDAEVLAGYGVHDTETGFSPDDSADWYWTFVEAQEYIDEYCPDDPITHKHYVTDGSCNNCGAKNFN